MENVKDEPSVLDFVKWFFSLNWNKPFEIPPENLKNRVQQVETSEDVASKPQITFEDRLKLLDAALPWRVLLAIFFALIAQLGLEPPRGYDHPSFTILILYFFSAIFAVWGVIAKEWSAPELETEKTEPMDTSVRWISLLAGLVAIPLALIAFAGNLFTEINVLLWALCLLYVVVAFWRFKSSSVMEWGRGGWMRFRSWVKDLPVIQIKLTPFLILMVVAIGSTLFFRLHELDQVPAEMWSDHAEKLLDVNDVLNGENSIYFIRNTGREPFQIYLTAFITRLGHMQLGFMALKWGTVLAGLVTLIYMYRLGKLVANPWVGLLVVMLAGAAYWPNIISRVALRYAYYPLFVAPLLFYLIRGLRTSSRNDMIKAGIALGLGLHGYSAYRIVPFLVVLGFVLYLLHSQSRNKRYQALGGLVVLTLVSLVIFLPLMSFIFEDPGAYASRAISRLVPEGPIEKPIMQIFTENAWRASIMFFWDNGEIWVHSIPHRPALDVITAVLYFLGVILLVARYVRQRNWVDLFLLLSIPVLLLPSILSLAFPAENPSLNRSAGAYVPVFVVAAIGLEAFSRALIKRSRQAKSKLGAGAVLVGLLVLMFSSNFNLVFDQFNNRFRAGVWNTREMGELIHNYYDSVGAEGTAYVVAYPHWVDTRLVAVNAGYVGQDFAIWPENFDVTLSDPRAKLFIIKADDTGSLEKLRQIYPNGSFWLQQVPELIGKDYYVFLVPAQSGVTNPD